MPEDHSVFVCFREEGEQVHGDHEGRGDGRHTPHNGGRRGDWRPAVPTDQPLTPAEARQEEEDGRAGLRAHPGRARGRPGQEVQTGADVHAHTLRLPPEDEINRAYTVKRSIIGVGLFGEIGEL